MIGADQPTLFPDDLLVGVSSRSDGTMLDRTGKTPQAEVFNNRKSFCKASGVVYDDVVFQKITYNDMQTYDQVVTVTKKQTVRYVPELAADALFTRESGVGLFLPVADCVATVMFDPVMRSLSLLHLGRHSTLTDLVPRVVSTFIETGSDVADLLVWMSPNAGRQTYRLDYFEAENEAAWYDFYDKKADGVYIDMAGYNRFRLVDAGVTANNIQISPINTMNNKDYFSHAAGDTEGRMAVLAMMR
jgi:copper oxidase (laccase) domain-containing protein